jgi:hypothetical protein
MKTLLSGGLSEQSLRRSSHRRHIEFSPFKGRYLEEQGCYHKHTSPSFLKFPIMKIDLSDTSEIKIGDAFSYL